MGIAVLDTNLEVDGKSVYRVLTRHVVAAESCRLRLPCVLLCFVQRLARCGKVALVLLKRIQIEQKFCSSHAAFVAGSWCLVAVAIEVSKFVSERRHQAGGRSKRIPAQTSNSCLECHSVSERLANKKMKGFAARCGPSPLQMGACRCKSAARNVHGASGVS